MQARTMTTTKGKDVEGSAGAHDQLFLFFIRFSPSVRKTLVINSIYTTDFRRRRAKPTVTEV